MTAREIRNKEGNSATFLREIAATLAEINERFARQEEQAKELVELTLANAKEVQKGLKEL